MDERERETDRLATGSVLRGGVDQRRRRDRLVDGKAHAERTLGRRDRVARVDRDGLREQTRHLRSARLLRNRRFALDAELDR